MGIREQRRAAIEADILRVGREHLARYGAAALSLRAVARELGMVSSGIYRYVESRDELLTRLIVSAYTSLAEQVCWAHDAVPAEDLAERWDAIGHALHDWALANPHDFALIYGSPVPGYAAPTERTAGPGTAVLAVLKQVLEDAHRDGRMIRSGGSTEGLARRAVADFLDDPFFAGSTLDHDGLARGLAAWTLLLGAVTSEVFDQLGPVAEPAALFECNLQLARSLWLAPGPGCGVNSVIHSGDDR